MVCDSEDTKYGAKTSKPEGCESERLSTGLWSELMGWRSHWKLTKFFEALVLGLAASLFDSVADLNFAWSVPVDCKNTTDSQPKPFHLDDVSSPCGVLYYKNVERLTFTYIAFPGYFLVFAGLRNLTRRFVSKCWGREVAGTYQKIGNFLSVALEVFLALGLLMAAWWSDVWEHATAQNLPEIARFYDFTIKSMAYLSFTIIVALKCLGVLCHGPKSTQLVFEATKTETIFEAANQLMLVRRLAISSGRETEAGVLSALSSLVLIGKVGVQNFLARHHDKLSSTTLLGKICVAASVLPVFILFAVVKIGIASFISLWNESVIPVSISLGVGLPMLILCFMHNFVQELEVTDVNQSVLSEMLSLHLWAKNSHGTKISLAMIVFIFFLYEAPVPFALADPEPITQWTTTESKNMVYREWAQETGARVRIASISALVVGAVAFVAAICLILFEDKWVAGIVSAFPEQSTQKNDVDKEASLVEEEGLVPAERRKKKHSMSHVDSVEEARELGI